MSAPMLCCPLHIIQLLLCRVFALLRDLRVIDGGLQASGDLVRILGDILVLAAVEGLVHGVEHFLGVSFGGFRSVLNFISHSTNVEGRAGNGTWVGEVCLVPLGGVGNILGCVIHADFGMVF